MPHVLIDCSEKKPMAVRVSDEVATKFATYLPIRKCLACNKQVAADGRYVRGLCQSDYQTARNVVTSGQKSEADLVKAGLMAPKPGDGHSARSEFRKRLAEL